MGGGRRLFLKQTIVLHSHKNKRFLLFIVYMRIHKPQKQTLFLGGNSETNILSETNHHLLPNRN